MSRLFDPDPCSEPHRRYRDEATPKVRTPTDVVEVVLGDVWRLCAGKKGPKVHAVRISYGAPLSYCGFSVVPLTFEHGQRAAACNACLNSGAPR